MESPFSLRLSRIRNVARLSLPVKAIACIIKVMKRIEDIKRIKKVRQTPPPEPVLELKESEDQQGEAISGNQQRPKIKNLWLKIVFFLFIVSLITLFWGFSLYRAKAKIGVQTSGLNKDFAAFLDAVSNKDTISLSKYIDSFNQKSQDSLLILQSTGQDVYVFSLIYPKGKSSQMTAMIDTVRAGHLLTSSYKRFVILPGIPTSSPEGGPFGAGNDWTAKANVFLLRIKSFTARLPSNILYAKISSGQAKAILDNISVFSTEGGPFISGEEKKIAENLSKLSEVSTTFFDYLTDLPDELNQNLTFSGGKKSYLILFQNNAEIRPGGGFLGSFARLDLEDGQIKKIDFEKNIYTLDKSYQQSGGGEKPPEEYSSLFATLLMRDSNNSADFADSAKNVLRFYQLESGNQVDGVVALDTTLFRDLLKIIGPISMPEYNLNIGADNFLSDVQYQIEIGYYQDQSNWSENQPKKILADMMPKFLAAIFKEKYQSDVSQIIMQGISEKHLLFYFNSEKLEDLADGINAAGIVHQSLGDYLYLSDANIGGYKSSLAIVETVKQNVIIDDGGNISEKLSVIRQHKGTNNYPDGTNNNFIKIFLPLASKINSVDFIAGDNNPRSDSTKSKNLKYEIGSQYEKTFVTFWQNTKPGETSQTDINYRRQSAIQLSTDSFDWQIQVQKQPGIESYDWQLDLVYPDGWRPQNVDGYDEKNRRITLSETIRSDSLFCLRFIRN